MTIKIFERPNSGSGGMNPPTLNKEYGLSGIDDDYIAKAYAQSAIDDSVLTPQGLLWLQDIDGTHEGFQLWGFRALYGKEKKQTGSFKFSFNTTGGTIHITSSKATSGKFAQPGKTATNQKQTIGVNKTGEPEGTDQVIPALKLDYTFKHPAGMISEAKARYLASITGMTNSVMWHGFQQGELLFLGAIGNEGTDVETEVTYSMACSANITGKSIGAIAGIAKKGHEYSWIMYEDVVVVDPDGNKPATQPKYVYVERIYEEIDFFAGLGF